MSSARELILEFGRELINARQYKNISVERIAEITKIDPRYLKAMEQGEWDLLPRPYMEAFLKAYADAVGMNVPKVMKKYREMVRQELVKPIVEEGEEEIEEAAEQPEEEPSHPIPPQRNLKIILGVGIALLVIIVLVLLLMPGGKRAEQTVPSEDTISTTEGREVPTGASEQPQAAEGGQVSESTDLTQVQKKVSTEVTVQAQATENCWLQATLDRGRIRDVLLAPEDTISLQSTHEIHLVVGNAGGLELVINDQPLGPLGPKDKPVTLVIGPEGIKSQRLGAWHVNYQGEIRPVIRHVAPEDSTF